MNEKKTYIILPDLGEFELNSLIEKAIELRKHDWTFDKWHFRAALIDIKGGSSREYKGQNYDDKHIKLVENGWTHDHCEFCWTKISEADDSSEVENEGYHYGNIWICKKCYEYFISPNDLMESLKMLKKTEK